MRGPASVGGQSHRNSETEIRNRCQKPETEKEGKGREMKGKMKLIIGGVVVILAGGLICARFLKKEPVVEYESRPTVAVEQPEQGNIELYTDVTGIVEPQSRASVMPKMGGEVLEVYFQAGDTVQAGQALIKIDSDALTSLQLQVDAAKVALDNANDNLSRTQALAADGFVSQQALEQAQNSAKSAQISYESAKHQYDLQVEYTTVTAPMDGVIESRNVEPHDHVSAQSVICEISGQNQLQVKFGVTEKTVKNMSLGDTLTVEKNGSSREGNITEIGSMVNSSTGLYDVKASLPQDGSLSNGTRVKITVVMDRVDNVMTIPVDAVNYDAGVPFVYVYDNGIANKTEIETGIYDSEKMQVISGLNAGDQVITTWSNELVAGQEVLLDNGTSSDASSAESSAESNADSETAADSEVSAK